MQPDDAEDTRGATPTDGDEYPLSPPETATEADQRGDLSERPEYVVQTPVSLRVRNRRSTSQILRVTLEIEPPSEAPEEVHDQSHEVPGDETVPIAEFEQHGYYHIRVEVGDQEYEERFTYVSMEQLADCNVTILWVILETGISLSGSTSDAGCPPATATPHPTGGDERD